MNPKDIGKAYDKITHLWQSADFDRNNGIEAHKRALTFVENRGKALDIGCGCTNRFIELILAEGFTPQGIDISEEMIRLAKQRHPDVVFHQQDICHWPLTDKFDFITAWDSLWHISLEQQVPVLAKLMASLHTDGVLIFSFGGTDEKSEHSDNTMGPEMYYATLGTNEFISLLISLGGVCKHLEYDQPPELHAYIIVQKM